MLQTEQTFSLGGNLSSQQENSGGSRSKKLEAVLCILDAEKIIQCGRYESLQHPYSREHGKEMGLKEVLSDIGLSGLGGRDADSHPQGRDDNF